MKERLFKNWHGGLLALIPLLLTIYNCQRTEDKLAVYREADYYLNLNDSVEYVGMNACKECHFLIYKSYLRTGMGLSFDTASPRKSAAPVTGDSLLFDKYSDLYIKPFWKGDSLMVMEYRECGGVIIHERTEHVNFVVGSGQHTNSHIFLSGSYAYQAPFTYYTQDGRFDLPPGFEDGHNSRFTRKIGLECMSCHNGFPDMVLGSENKYERIPDGIDCERCHGPGEIHVMLKKKSILVDTSKYIDYSIVNPAKLPMDLQTDLCARCHLQGTMVLQAGKSFYDYKPGMSLHTVMDIFMPLFEGGREDFIMASHYERMVQSKCYLGSDKGFTCTGCHNPHISKRETPVARFNRICHDCHDDQSRTCAGLTKMETTDGTNCVSCHMREGPTRDIPHVTTHDHKISIPPSEDDLSSTRVFKGLVSVNNPGTDDLTKARGYLLEYESFHPDPAYLDSAWFYLKRSGPEDRSFYMNALVNYYFLRNDHAAIQQLVEKTGISRVLDSLLAEMEYSNYDAWTAYRIGQAYENLGNGLMAVYFYKRATELAPFQLDFQAKYGNLLAITGNYTEAKAVFEFIAGEDPRLPGAWVNLGYISVREGHMEKGRELYQRALDLDPDHTQALLNMAALSLYHGEKASAFEFIDRILAIDPGNEQALSLKNGAGSAP